MISIVVCSADKSIFNTFSRSVENTIGVPFEIIRVENNPKKYSICKAYNIGKLSCKYDIVCFSHEDVEFITQNWGRILVDIMKDQRIGLVGVQGACYLSLFPVDWIDPAECEGQFIEGLHPERPERILSRFGTNPAEVVATDGVFMATRKEIMDRLAFSEDLLDDFHGYDFDICMQIRKTHKIVVSRDILLAHSSRGGMNKKYFEAVEKLARKWRSILPVYVDAYTRQEIQEIKIKSLHIYCRKEEHKRSVKIKYRLVALFYAFRYGVLIKWVKEAL